MRIDLIVFRYMKESYFTDYADQVFSATNDQKGSLKLSC